MAFCVLNWVAFKRTPFIICYCKFNKEVSIQVYRKTCFSNFIVCHIMGHSQLHLRLCLVWLFKQHYYQRLGLSTMTWFLHYPICLNEKKTLQVRISKTCVLFVQMSLRIAVTWWGRWTPWTAEWWEGGTKTTELSSSTAHSPRSSALTKSLQPNTVLCHLCLVFYLNSFDAMPTVFSSLWLWCR